jgi:hypothetical protein
MGNGEVVPAQVLDIWGKDLDLTNSYTQLTPNPNSSEIPKHLEVQTLDPWEWGRRVR